MAWTLHESTREYGLAIALVISALTIASCSDGTVTAPAKTGSKFDVIFPAGDSGGFDGFDGWSLDGFKLDAPHTDNGGNADGLWDSSVPAGSFGAPCQIGSDCDSGWCVQGPDAKVCSQACTDGCPGGWICKQSQGGIDTSFLCQPTTTHLCQPCTTSANCNDDGGLGNLCVPFGATGNFCGIACNPATPGMCPGTYQCMDVTDQDGKAAHQCLPPEGVCECNTFGKQLAAWTTCAHKNFSGTCAGQRHCGPNGLTECDAPVPAAETCNAVDDDCNGQTDDAVPSTACQIDNAFGVCKGKTVGCQGSVPVCDAETPKPEICNGLDDDCDGQTDNDICDDGNPCTVGSCSGSGCKQVPTPEGLPCNDGNACTLSDVCAATTCIGGQLLDCDDKNGCTQDACDPKVGCVHTALEGTPCADDGNICTQDMCHIGKCAHPGVAAGAACETDNNPCTSDTCDGKGICKSNASAGVCTINGLCVPSGSVDPTDPCKACVPALSKTAYMPMNGLTCDDGDACTIADQCQNGTCKGNTKDCSAKDGGCLVGVCQAGVCTSQPKDGLCDDGDPCTTNDSCQSGSCTGKAKDCSALGDGCHAGVCLGGSCVVQSKSGTACDDGNACTVNDTCTSGVCNGSVKDCSASSGTCAIGVCQGGTCAAQPINQGGLCNDGNPCTVGDMCLGGSCNGKAMDCSGLNDACGVGTCSFGQCVKSGQGLCTPGQVETDSQACGNCGSQTRTRSCTSNCGWGSWSAWGGCGSQGVCAPGATDSASQACGNCGNQSHSRTCNASCQWDAFGGWSGCSGQGTCAPGATQGCGDTSAPCEQQTCGSNCQWGGCGLKPGAACTWKSGTHYQCCGTNQWQFCSSSCKWFGCAATSNACF